MTERAEALAKALERLSDEFVKVFPIYYYAEPWAHDRNVALKAARAALEAYRSQPDGWRPIEEAPRETVYQDGSNHYGRHILVWCGWGTDVHRARWWQTDGGKSNFITDGSYAVFPEVWQPLPTPPATPANAKGSK